MSPPRLPTNDQLASLVTAAEGCANPNRERARPGRFAREAASVHHCQVEELLFNLSLLLFEALLRECASWVVTTAFELFRCLLPRPGECRVLDSVHFSLSSFAWPANKRARGLFIPCVVAWDPKTGEFSRVEDPHGFDDWLRAEEASRFLIAAARS